VLVVPLLGPEGLIGMLVVRRKAPGEFPQHTLDLLQTFAAQSVLAIQNANLFTEVEEGLCRSHASRRFGRGGFSAPSRALSGCQPVLLVCIEDERVNDGGYALITARSG
jgi:GAF domain-containing protein